MYNREILKMNAEFSVDDDGKIWFLFAHDVIVAHERPDRDVTNRLEYIKIVLEEKDTDLNMIERLENPIFKTKKDFKPISFDDSPVVK